MDMDSGFDFEVQSMMLNTRSRDGRDAFNWDKLYTSNWYITFPFPSVFGERMASGKIESLLPAPMSKQTTGNSSCEMASGLLMVQALNAPIIVYRDY